MKKEGLFLVIFALVSVNVAFANGSKAEAKAITPYKALGIVTACTALNLKDMSKNCKYNQVYEAEKVLEKVAGQDTALGVAASKTLEARQAVLDLNSEMTRAGQDTDGVGDKD